MKKLKHGFFMNGVFNLGEEGKIETNRFFDIVMN